MYKRSLFLQALLTAAISFSAMANENAELAIDFLKTACAANEEIEIIGDGSGGISILKRGVEGQVYFSKRETRGVIDGLNAQMQSEQLSEFRECMTPYIERLLDAILGETDESLSEERVKIGALCNEGLFSEASSRLAMLVDQTGARENVNNDRQLTDLWDRCDRVYVNSEVDTLVSTSNSGLYVEHNGIHKAELSGHFWSRAGTGPGLFDITLNVSSDGVGCWIGSFGPEIGPSTEWQCVIRGTAKIGVVLSLPDEYTEVARTYGFFDQAICEVEADFTGSNRFELIACYVPRNRKFACVLKLSNTLGVIEDRFIHDCIKKAAS